MAKLRHGRPKRLVLDIGSSAIRLCELTQTKAGYQLTKYYQREILNDPALDEEAKKVRRREALAALLKESKVRTKKCIISVPGRSVFTRKRTLPPVPEFKVTQIVRYEIQQQIPFALDQIALDYQILGRTEAGGYDVMMAAIKVDVIDKHLEVVREAKRAIAMVDVGPIAAYNWLRHTGEFGDESKCVALLDLGASTTDIVIERNGQFHFTRPLNIGGDDITRAISQGFGVNFQDAEKLKRERAFAPTGDPQRDGRAGEVVGPVLSRMVNEITRSFSYFRSLPGGGTVDRVIVTGGGACLRNIVPYLQKQLGIEVRIAQPLAGLAIGPGAQQAQEHPEQAVVALGMALRACEPTTIEINLIPPRVLEAARRREQAFYWVLSILLMGAIAASVIPAQANKDKLLRAQIDTYKTYVRMFDPVLEQNPKNKSKFEGELMQAKAQVDARIGELNTLNEARKARFFLGDLDILFKCRPEGNKIWLSSVQSAEIAPNVGRGDGGGFGGGGPMAGPGPMGGVNSPVTVAPFPGIGPRGGMTTQGPGGLGGPRQQQQGQQQQAQEAPKPPYVNGYRVVGYARTPEALLEFIGRLREQQRFSKGVYFEQAAVKEVPETTLYNAAVAPGGVVAARTGGMEREQGRLGQGMYNPNLQQGPGAAPQGPKVLEFHVDLQFGDPQSGQAPGPGGPGPVRGGPPMMGPGGMPGANPMASPMGRRARDDDDE